FFGENAEGQKAFVRDRSKRTGSRRGWYFRRRCRNCFLHLDGFYHSNPVRGRVDADVASLGPAVSVVVVVHMQEHDVLSADERDRAIALVDTDRFDAAVAGRPHALKIKTMGRWIAHEARHHVEKFGRYAIRKFLQRPQTT